MSAALTMDRPEALFAVARDRFEQAERVAGRIDRHLSIGGLAITLRYAGEALEPVLGRAFRHVETAASATSQCTVLLWDTASTGVPMTAPPSGFEQFNRRGELRAHTDGTRFAALNAEGLVLSLFDASTSTAVLWSRDWRTIPYSERASPLRLILHWCLRTQGRQLLHAGAIGTAEGAVLLAGPGGSGKSNTALGALATSLGYLSDDYCAVAAAPEPRVFSLYSTGKTLRSDLTRMGHLAPHVSNPDPREGDKAVYFLHEGFRDRLLREAPVRAVMLPRVTAHGPTRIRPASRGEALRALAPSTIAQLAYAGAEVASTLAGILRHGVPCLHLDIARGETSAPALIESWLINGTTNR